MTCSCLKPKHLVGWLCLCSEEHSSSSTSSSWISVWKIPRKVLFLCLNLHFTLTEIKALFYQFNRPTVNLIGKASPSGDGLPFTLYIKLDLSPSSPFVSSGILCTSIPFSSMGENSLACLCLQISFSNWFITPSSKLSITAIIGMLLIHIDISQVGKTKANNNLGHSTFCEWAWRLCSEVFG